MLTRNRLILSLIYVAFFITASLQAQTKIYPAKNTYYTIKQEKAYIKEFGSGITEPNPVIRNKQIDSYLNQLVVKLQKNAPAYAKNFNCKAVIVLSQSLDAKTGLGCLLNIGVGTLSSAKSESEFAGMVAHELSHGILRHSIERATLELNFNRQIEALDNEQVLYSRNSKEFIALKSRIRQLKKERDRKLERQSKNRETDADVLATQIITKAGFDPRDWQAFFEDRTDFDIFIKSHSKTHPTSEARAKRIAQEIAILTKPESHSDSSKFLEAKAVSSTITAVFFKQAQ